MLYECCKSPSIAVFDYKNDGDLILNRVCIKCHHHWHKDENFTVKEWDKKFTDYEHTPRVKKFIPWENVFGVKCLLEV